MEKRPRWMRLDNAAKIYPAARSRRWSNLFRVSATLIEEVETVQLQTALATTLKRFPSMAVRLRRGLFWYYLEEITTLPKIQPEYAYPLVPMSVADIRKCAFRVIVYRNRLAVEFFHSVTDGTGAMIFLKTLVAEYLRLRYGVDIAPDCDVLDTDAPPSEAELEDSFLKNDGLVSFSRSEANAYKLGGTVEPDGYLNLITGILDVNDVLALAKRYGVSLTTLIGGVMADCIVRIQNRHVPDKRRQKPVKLCIPVNLRRMFGSKSLRNFALYINPGIDPKMGDYTLEEILRSLHHQMGMELDSKRMAARITANVKLERLWVVRAMPLFLKNLVMKIVFYMVGERKSCLTISNLGRVELPDTMVPYVERIDFILGPQATCKNNCGILSYGDKLYIHLLRTIRETELEHEFFTALKQLGLSVKLESNQRGE